ncbi:hypothetical protein EMPS_03250 [Entomortierella parvispora]|uniref:Uncharacterized protein n=1 Tax=Entomortierella parvispora TaxID=205924 RepID=A0A9P3LUQ1_9FUNG|nr:hypothetical protein EMPS_03250 [Entomortierella parvispora]
MHGGLTQIADLALERAELAWIQQFNLKMTSSASAYKNIKLPERRSTCTFFGQIREKVSEWSESVRTADPDADFRNCSLLEYRHDNCDTQRIEELVDEKKYRNKEGAWRSELSNARRCRRLKMLQQQKEAGYRTDYDRDNPMVDGLEDFEFCGSFLDVEACLQARVWRLQQQQFKAREGDMVAAKFMSLGVDARVWPNMEQFIFTISLSSFSSLHKNQAMIPERRCRRMIEVLKPMRQDIEFLLRFKEEKSPYQ